MSKITYHKIFPGLHDNACSCSECLLEQASEAAGLERIAQREAHQEWLLEIDTVLQSIPPYTERLKHTHE